MSYYTWPFLLLIPQFSFQLTYISCLIRLEFVFVNGTVNSSTSTTTTKITSITCAITCFTVASTTAAGDILADLFLTVNWVGTSGGTHKMKHGEGKLCYSHKLLLVSLGLHFSALTTFVWSDKYLLFLFLLYSTL